jgi:hypothetical protein
LDAEDLANRTNYVRRGGVLFADVGFDCLRAGKVVTAMSEDAKRLFGIKSLRTSVAGHGRFTATGEFAELLGGLTKNTDATDAIFQMALDVEPDTATAALRGPGGQGLYVNRLGNGFAIFCSALGWSRWSVKDPLFRKIHNALFARRAKIERLGDDDWSNVHADRSLAPGYELARYVTGYAMQNRTDNPLALSVRVEGRQRRHDIAPHSVVLVKGDRETPLGSGILPKTLP